MPAEPPKYLVEGPFNISQAMDVDFDRILEIQFAAFGSPGDPHFEPLHELLFPGGNTPAVRANAVERTLGTVSDPTATFLVAREKSTGTIVAAAKWHIYEDKPEEMKIDVDWYEEGEQREYAECAINGLHFAKLAKLPQGPHMCEYTHLFPFCVDRSSDLES